MPDILTVVARRWKMIVLLPILAAAVAFLGALLAKKLYVGTATALPVNTLLNDRARIFNPNVEALYSELGTVDELDKLEGTSKLDTVYLRTVDSLNLVSHYEIEPDAEDAAEKAALRLRKASDVYRTGFGEFQVKVWDENSEMAAALANALISTIKDIHRSIQTKQSEKILQELKEDYRVKQQEMKEMQKARLTKVDGIDIDPGDVLDTLWARRNFNDPEVLMQQLQQYQKLIYEYELTVKTTPDVLVIVEPARPSPWIDRPKTSRNVLFAFGAGLMFSFLFALFLESREQQRA